MHGEQVNKLIAVIDFGSQTTQLIVRRIREAGVYSIIIPCDEWEEIFNHNTIGVILSGGPGSVYEKGSPKIPIDRISVPILGICYGMQLIVHQLGGEIAKGDSEEYGPAALKLVSDSKLLSGADKSTVWMSHKDRVSKLPLGFKQIGTTENIQYSAIEDRSRNIYGIQFHPEVSHTIFGKEIIENFVKVIAGSDENWNMERFLSDKLKSLRENVSGKKVIVAVSGGVDSTVTAVLLQRAGAIVLPVFINNGLLRYGEEKIVVNEFKSLGINLIYKDASELFLDKLANVEDPEKKRKIIGHIFIDLFKDISRQYGDIEYLAQGTLYPDVIESRGTANSSLIKSHHNVGGLPKELGFKLVEPLRELFKDEVRELGKKLEIADGYIDRQPFPGPGLAIRIVGKITKDRINILRIADKLLLREMKKSGYYLKVWQSFAVLLPIRSVGVMGDNRTYDYTICIRIVDSLDGMTADWVYLPEKLLRRISSRIINETDGINRVVYDLSTKPPSTIEWE